jgi:hypothetical protein
VNGWLTSAAGVILAIGAAVTLLWKAGRGMLRTIRKLGHLADEVLGDGKQKQGWGKRLTAIEGDVAVMKTRITATLAEVKPNGGDSLKDQISRIEHATGATRDGEG